MRASRILLRRARLLSLALLFPALACTQNYSYVLGPAGETGDDAFPAIQKLAVEELARNHGGFRLRVLFPPGEAARAEEALNAASKTMQYLQDVTGRQQSGLATFYLHPVGPNGSIPQANPRGRGDYTGILYYREDVPLLDLEANRRPFFTTYTHEVAHSFLEDLPIEDRWLGDGLPEYLAREFARREAPEIYRAFHPWTPAIVAIQRVPVEPWTLEDFRMMEELRATDPERAFYVAEETVWRYAAAGEFVRRWVDEAQEEGHERPIRHLLGLIGEHPEPIDIDAIEDLVRSGTGASVAEIVRVSEEEEARARSEAWRDRHDVDLATRLHALRVLTFLGLPEGEDGRELVGSVEIPTEATNPPVWRLVHAAGTAIAQSGDPAAALAYLEAVEEHPHEVAGRAVPPEIWRPVASRDRETALRRLVEMISDETATLAVRERANQVLIELSNRDTGWSVEASPAERREAAARWMEELPPGAGAV